MLSRARHLDRRIAARVLFAATALLAGLCSIGRPDDSRDVPTDSPIIGKFAVGKCGRPILLPITLQDASASFLLDTGASCSAIDLTLRELLGEPRGTRTLRTSVGPTRVKTYAWPQAVLGNRPLRTDSSVSCVDLSYLRRIGNVDVSGVIGMDILRNCRVLIDFDRGIVRFIDRLPEDRESLGTKIPIQFGEDGCPTISGRVARDRAENFQIDTGADTNSLRDELYDELLDRNLVVTKSSYATGTAAGDVRGERGRLHIFAIGPFTRKQMRFSRMNPSALGRQYLARFRVTFDFPGEAVYLREGEQFNQPEPRATCGLAINWVDGAVQVQGVQKDGPGEKAGIRAQDVLVRVAGKPAEEFDHFELRQLLTSVGGRKVPLTIRRAGRDIDVELTLNED